MKASIKFREEHNPMVRAKVPISVFGLPFISGIVAGDARELRFDLATAFDSGPSLRLSYRPNDAAIPFSLVLKTGIGHLGSPAAAPLAMAAEFCLLGRTPSGSPGFSILLKPRFGDFTIKRSVRSQASAPPPPPPTVIKVGVEGEANGEGSLNGLEVPINGILPLENGLGRKALNGFPTSIAASRGGIAGLVSGLEITARSFLPLWSCAGVRFQWGLRVPPELRAALTDDVGRASPMSGVSLSKIPLLVMSKISIEHLAGESKGRVSKPAAAAGDVASEPAGVCSMLNQLQVETGMLRRTVEELRAEIAGGKSGPMSGGQVYGGTDASKESGRPAASVRMDRRGSGGDSDNSGRARAEEASGELKKEMNTPRA